MTQLKILPLRENRNILAQVFAFNLEQLQIQPDFYESYFIIGYLKYFKEGNLGEALEHFEKFLKRAGKIKKYRLLKK